MKFVISLYIYIFQNQGFVRKNKKLFYFFLFIVNLMFKFLKKIGIFFFLIVFFYPVCIIWKSIKYILKNIMHVLLRNFILLFFHNWINKLCIIFILFFYYYFFFQNLFVEQRQFVFSENTSFFYNYTYNLVHNFLEIEASNLYSSTSPFLQFPNNFPNFYETLNFPFKIKTKYDLPMERGISQFYYTSILQHSEDLLHNIDTLDYWTLRRKFLKSWAEYDHIFKILMNSPLLFSISFIHYYCLYLVDIFFFPLNFFVDIKYKLIGFFLSQKFFSSFFLGILFFPLFIIKYFVVQWLFWFDDFNLVNFVFSIRLTISTIIQLFFDDLFGLIFRYIFYLRSLDLPVNSYISTFFYDAYVDFSISNHVAEDEDDDVGDPMKLALTVGENLYSFSNDSSFFVFSTDLNAFMNSFDFFSRFLNYNSYHYYIFYEFPFIFNDQDSFTYPIIDTQFFYIYDFFFTSFNDFYYSRILQTDFFMVEEFFYRDFFDFFFESDFFKSALNYSRRLSYMKNLFEYMVTFNEVTKYDFFSHFTDLNESFNSYSDYFRKYFDFLDLSLEKHNVWRPHEQQSSDVAEIPLKNPYYWTTYTYILLYAFLKIFDNICLLLIVVFFNIKQFFYYYLGIQLLLFLSYLIHINFHILKYNLLLFYKNYLLLRQDKNIFFLIHFTMFCLCLVGVKIFLLFIHFFFYFLVNKSKKLFPYFIFFIFYLRNILTFFFQRICFVFIYYRLFFLKIFSFFFLYFLVLFFFIFFMRILQNVLIIFFKCIFFFVLLYVFLVTYYYFSILFFSTELMFNHYHLNKLSNFDINSLMYVLTIEDTKYTNFFILGLIFFLILFLSLFSNKFRNECLSSDYLEFYYLLESVNLVAENQSQPGQVFDFFHYNVVSDDSTAKTLNYMGKFLPEVLVNFLRQYVGGDNTISDEIGPLYSSMESSFKDNFLTGQAPFSYIINNSVGHAKRDFNFLFKNNNPSYFLSENRIVSFNGIRLLDCSQKAREFLISKTRLLEKKNSNVIFFYFLLEKGKFSLALSKINELHNFNNFQKKMYYSILRNKKDQNQLRFHIMRYLDKRSLIYMPIFKKKFIFFLLKYYFNKFIVRKNLILRKKLTLKKQLKGLALRSIKRIEKIKRFLFLSYETVSSDPLILKKNVRKKKKVLFQYIRPLMTNTKKKQKINKKSRKEQKERFNELFYEFEVNLKNAGLLYDLFSVSKFKKGFLVKNRIFLRNNLPHFFLFKNAFFYTLLEKSFFLDYEKYNINFSRVYFISQNYDFKQTIFKPIRFRKSTIASYDDSLNSNKMTTLSYIHLFCKIKYQQYQNGLKFLKILSSNAKKKSLFFVRTSSYGRDLNTRWGYYVNRNFWNYSYLVDEDEEWPFFFISEYFSFSRIHYSGPISYHNTFGLEFDPEFDFLNTYDNYEYAFDDLDFNDNFYDPYEDEHPFSEKFFDYTYYSNVYFPNYLNPNFIVPFELNQFQKSFSFSATNQDVLTNIPLWFFDVVIDRFFVNILNHNLVFPSDRMLLANLSSISSLKDLDFLSNRDKITQFFYLKFLQNIPFFTMRKLNRFFWFRTLHLTLVHPFVTGSDDFFLSSSRFYDWHSSFYKNLNVSFFSRYNNFSSYNKYNFEEMLTSNFTFFFYNPYNSSFLMELRKLLCINITPIHIEEIYSNKFKREFFLNLDYYIELLKLRHFPNLTKSETDRLFLYFGCNKKTWDSQDSTSKYIIHVYDVWDFPIVFFFLILISFLGKYDLLAFYIDFDDIIVTTGFSEVFLTTTDIPEPNAMYSNYINNLNGGHFFFDVNPLNFFIVFETLFIPSLDFFYNIIYEIFSFFLFQNYIYMSNNVLYNSLSFYNLLSFYLNHFATHEFFFCTFIYYTFYNFLIDFFPVFFFPMNDNGILIIVNIIFLLIFNFISLFFLFILKIVFFFNYFIFYYYYFEFLFF